jgi:hypothetical protein
VSSVSPDARTPGATVSESEFVAYLYIEIGLKRHHLQRLHVLRAVRPDLEPLIDVVAERWMAENARDTMLAACMKQSPLRPWWIELGAGVRRAWASFWGR